MTEPQALAELKAGSIVSWSLVPCPSGHTRTTRDNNNIYRTWWVKCNDGECSWRTAGDTEAEAVAAWNQRTRPEPSGEPGGEVIQAVDPTDPMEALLDPDDAWGQVGFYKERLRQWIDECAVWKERAMGQKLVGEGEKVRPEIGHAEGCRKINCRGCGTDFYTTDYSHEIDHRLTTQASPKSLVGDAVGEILRAASGSGNSDMLKYATLIEALIAREAVLREEIDRFQRPNARSLSTDDPIAPLPTFSPQHLLGLALTFREWPNAALWGRPAEAELAARQVETAFAQITALRGVLKPFSRAADDAERFAGHDGPLDPIVSLEACRSARALTDGGKEHG